MIRLNAPIAIPEQVEVKLQQVRAVRHRMRLSQAMIATVLTLLLAMAAAMLIDWEFTLFDTFWRSVLTGSALTVSSVTLLSTMFLHVLRKRELSQIAGEVDESVPQLEERWSTVAELAAAPLDQQRRIHTGMLNRLTEEAASLEPRVVADDVVSKKNLKRLCVALGSVVVVILVAFMLDWRQTSVLMMRFWAPTSNISVTQLTVSAENQVAARGEPVTVKARMDGRPVDEAMLFMKADAGGPEEQIVLRPSGTDSKEFAHRIRAAETSLLYRLRAGDGQTEWQSVAVADRPDIAEVRFRIVPPAYTGKEAVEVGELPEKISTVEDSQLEVFLRPRDPVRHVVFRCDDDRMFPLTSADGRWYQFTTTLTEDLKLAAVLTESHGLENKHPPVCRITVYPDKAPSVTIISPTEEMAARPDDEIEIQYSAEDDLGISRIELVIYSDDVLDGSLQEEHVIEVPLDDKKGQTLVEGVIPLDLKPFQLADGESLNYAVRVYDTHQAIATTSAPESQLPTEQPADDRPKTDTPQTGSEPAASSTPVLSDPGQEKLPATQGDSPLTAQPSSGKAPPDRPTAETQTVPKSPSARPKHSPELSKKANSNAGTGAKARQTDRSSATSATGQSQAASADNQSASPQQPDKQPTQTSTRPPQSNDSQSQAEGASRSQGASASGKPKKDSSEQTGAPPPADNMTRRVLDIPQAGSSGVMKLKIDKWSGSFAGQQRQKLEMMIAPALEKIDQYLKTAEQHLRETLDDLEGDVVWAGAQSRNLQLSNRKLTQALELIGRIRDKSADTPYTFVGLRLEEVADTHLMPAKDSLWSGTQADTNSERQPHVKTAWQQIGRARQRLAQLVTRFERIRREHALADAVEQVKEMYQVFVEDSIQLLAPGRSPINNYQRKMAQFDLDEEYLKRLEEVLKMRQKLIAEFARILGEDPRLLRRFVDSLNNQTDSLRDQLTLLTLQQQELDTQARTWQQLDEDLRPHALQGIIRLKLQESADIAREAAQIQEDFDTWAPLDLGVTEENLAAVRQELAAIAEAARDVENKAAAWKPMVDAQNAEADTDSDTEENPTSQNTADPSASLLTVITPGRAMYEQLRVLDARLVELPAQIDHPAIGPFVVRRLADTRRLIAHASAWIHQLTELDKGRYHVVASVDQYQIAQKTNELTANLADIEQQLSGILGGDDGELPEDIAMLSRKLLTILDEEVAASQLGAVFALRRNILGAAAARTHVAAESMVKAEQVFDELMKRALEEADKLPVQDPIADLLDDPTLDELLALLENEADLAAALGIPVRPSNLRVIRDFLRPGSSGGGGAGMGGMVMPQLNAQQRMLQRARQRATKRAQDETKKLAVSKKRQIDDWNKLASELADKLLQGQDQLPPERYRRAIEQYFQELSRITAE